MEDVTDLCGRCGKEVHGLAEEELCLFCEGNLCRDCWEEFGSCVHPETEDWQRRMRAATTHEERAKLMAELGPIGNPKTRRREH